MESNKQDVWSCPRNMTRVVGLASSDWLSGLFVCRRNYYRIKRHLSAVQSLFHICSIQFQSFCHLPTKIYQNWLKFDKVLTKTKSAHFFLRHGTVQLPSGSKTWRWAPSRSNICASRGECNKSHSCRPSLGLLGSGTVETPDTPVSDHIIHSFIYSLRKSSTSNIIHNTHKTVKQNYT